MGTMLQLEGDELKMFAEKLRELSGAMIADALFGDTKNWIRKIRLWPNEQIEFEYGEPTSDAEAIAADRTIDYLLTWLTDEDKLMTLAMVGPCAFHLGWDDLAAGPISISIENYIPWAEPNTDWELNPDEGGLRFTG